MKKMALRTLLLAFLCMPCAASPPAIDGIVSEVPFSFEKGYVIVQAKILRQMPAEMVLATGAEYSTFNGGMMDKYKLPVLNFTYDNPKRCIHPDCTYSFTNITNITLGDLKPVTQTMRLGTLDNVEKKIGRQVFGMLGADFFKGRVVQFDFKRKVVRFLPKSSSAASNDNKTLSATNRIVLRMAFYDEYTILPIAEDVTFDGKKIKTVIDTGAPIVVALSPSATKQLGLPLPPEKSVPHAGNVSLLRLGDYELTNVPVLLYGKGMGFDRDSTEFGAIAGVGLLQNFIATFDFPNKTIILERV